MEKLLKEKGWPYYKQFSTQHESESELLQDFELCLRLLSNPQDRLHLGALLARWNIEDRESVDRPVIPTTANPKEQKIYPLVSSPRPARA
uniref:Uncharacterized protein n=1 Tax=Candidatus Kentrum sp. FW TaxID=2126338 RepID=A0A450SG78_9GAMM|nr:MAG: hypothetical protein BECKFW1821A_GA0114235_10345 [Candidatus Kentron sp. FW]